MRFIPDGPDEKMPMDPEDYSALREWVKAKEGRGDPIPGHKAYHPRL